MAITLTKQMHARRLGQFSRKIAQVLLLTSIAECRAHRHSQLTIINLEKKINEEEQLQITSHFLHFNFKTKILCPRKLFYW